MKIEHKNMSVELIRCYEKSDSAYKKICVSIGDYIYEKNISGLEADEELIDNTIYDAKNRYLNHIASIPFDDINKLSKMVLEVNKPKIDQSV